MDLANLEEWQQMCKWKTWKNLGILWYLTKIQEKNGQTKCLTTMLFRDWNSSSSSKLLKKTRKGDFTLGNWIFVWMQLAILYHTTACDDFWDSYFHCIEHLTVTSSTGIIICQKKTSSVESVLNPKCKLRSFWLN